MIFYGGGGLCFANFSPGPLGVSHFACFEFLALSNSATSDAGSFEDFLNTCLH